MLGRRRRRGRRGHGRARHACLEVTEWNERQDLSSKRVYISILKKKKKTTLKSALGGGTTILNKPPLHDTESTTLGGWTDLEPRKLDEVGREHDGAAVRDALQHGRLVRHQPQPVRVDHCPPHPREMGRKKDSGVCVE